MNNLQNKQLFMIFFKLKFHYSDFVILKFVNLFFFVLLPHRYFENLCPPLTLCIGFHHLATNNAHLLRFHVMKYFAKQ